MESNTIQIGDEFRCKRRGHILRVFAFDAIDLNVYVRSSSRRNICISANRLLKPYRFERVVVQAAIPAESAV